MKEEEIKQQYLKPESNNPTWDEMRAFVNSSLTGMSQPMRVISQQIESAGFVEHSDTHEGNGWKFDAQGNLYANDGNFRGDITGASGTFSGTITASAGDIGGWNIDATRIYSDGDEIILDSANKKIESGNYVSGVNGEGFHISEDLFETANISARGLIRTAVFQKDVISSVGGNFMVIDSDMLNVDMTADDTTPPSEFYVLLITKNTTTFAVGDTLRIKDGTDDEWFGIASDNGNGNYSVLRDLASAYASDTNPTWKKGATVVNYGQSGDGGIFMTASESNAPYLSVFTHAGSPWTDLTTRLRIGNLNGYLGYSADNYGIGIGSSTGTDANLVFDPTNGIRLRQGTTDKITLDNAGNATFNGTVTIVGGSGLANLSDAGSLAILDDVGAGNCDTTIISGGKIITGLLTATNIETGMMNAARINGGDINGVTITGVTITGGTVRTAESGQRIVMTGDNFSSFSGTQTYAEVVLDSKELWFNMGSAEFGGASGTKLWQSDNGELSVLSYTGALNATFKVIADASFEGIYTDKNLSIGQDIHLGTDSFIKMAGSSVLKFETNFVRTQGHLAPFNGNVNDLGNSGVKYRHLYLDQNIYLDTGQYICWNGTAQHLRHDGTVFRINDDLQPTADGTYRLGYTDIAWYAVHSDNYLGCNLPTSISGINVFKKIKEPKLKVGKAKGYHAGDRHYFEIDEFPDEMKMIDKDSGKKDIELTRTTGVMVSAVRELIEKFDNFNSRLEALEKKLK